LMWPSSVTYLKGLGFTAAVVWRTPRRVMPPPGPHKKGMKCGYKLGTRGRKRGEINKKPSPASRNRLPSRRFFMGRLGRGVWRMGLGVLSRPAGCWSWLRPRGVSAPHGTVPVSCWRWLRGHLCGAGVGSGHPCGGTETGPNRADARRKSSNRYALAGVGSACMAVEGLNSGNGEHTKIQQKRKG
jgi:hypothetical protein